MARPYHPDDSGMTWQRGDRRNNGGGNNNGPRMPSIISPAETRTLAEDMASEFGGRERAWRRDLNWQPRQFQYGGGHGGGHGNGGGNNPGGNGDGNGGGGGFDPSNPRNRMRADIYGTSGYGPGAMGFGPAVRGPLDAQRMPTQIPQGGLLAMQPQQQPQQQQGLLGAIPPEVLAFLSQNIRR